MNPSAPEDWRAGGSRMVHDQHRADMSNRDSWGGSSGVSDRPGSGSNNNRRLSDGAPPPFNRTRSFKTKQLVRSQAIRESQSPPRIPSPRPPGATEPSDKSKILPSVKKKSLSVDLDDRNNSEEFRQDRMEKTPIILKKDNSKNVNVSSVKNSTSSDTNSGAISENDKCYTDKVDASKKVPNQIGDDKSGSVESDSSVSRARTESDDDKTLKSVLNNNNSKRSNMNIDSGAKNETGIDKDCCDTYKNVSPNSECSKIGVSKIKSNNNNTIDSSVDIRAAIGRNAPSQNRLHKPEEDTALRGRSEETAVSAKPSLAETRKQSSFGNSLEGDGGQRKMEKASVSRGGSVKVEFQQVEIQVTSGDYDTISHSHDSIVRSKMNRRCDCGGFGKSLDLEEDEEDQEDWQKWRGGRRAICPSKQDSGVCCWESCTCCGDLSPDINMSFSDAEDEMMRPRRQKHVSEHDGVHHQSIDNCRCQDKLDRWPSRRSGSTLTVQRAASGGNPRLLRKQSSGGSVDSGQHSIASPFLSRDNSTELMMAAYNEPIDMTRFIKDTLNKSYKDRIMLLKIEHDLVALVRDPTRREQKFQQSSSYGRLLIHRCAELFNLKHGVDSAKQTVSVTKPLLGAPQCRVPPICPFQQWCVVKFPSSPTPFCEQTAPAKSILKRDSHSLDEEAANLQPSRPTPRSKSFEQREEEYSKARQRIFNTTGEEEQDAAWEWEEGKGNEGEEQCKPRLLVPEGDRASRSGRLLKVQSLESRETAPVVRGVVSKAHSFGGYGDRQSVKREDSTVSTASAPPQRILSHKGELASSNWRLSPGNSSGYRTLSARSDSITPSPTPNTGAHYNTGDGGSTNNGVLWAITDMSSVPVGALIIHPQTGQPLTNCDGSLYHYDPAHPPNADFLNKSQVSVEGVRVLTNPERRRSRLEKQRATLSPSTDADSNNSDKIKTPENGDPHINADKTSSSDENYSSDEKTASKKPDDDNSNLCVCLECQTDNGGSKSPNKNKETTGAPVNNKDTITKTPQYVTDTNKTNLNPDKSKDTRGLTQQNPPSKAQNPSNHNSESSNQDSPRETDNLTNTNNERARNGSDGRYEPVVSALVDGKANEDPIRRQGDYYTDPFGYRNEIECDNALNAQNVHNPNMAIVAASKSQYEFQDNCEGQLMEDVSGKADYCIRDEPGMYEQDERRQQQNYLVAAPTYTEQPPAYYGNIQQMAPYYESATTFDETNPEMQAYQSPSLALRPGCPPLQQPQMIFQSTHIPPPPLQAAYTIQEPELQPFPVAPAPGVVPQPPPHIYQVGSGGGWSWPHVVYGPPPAPPPPLQDAPHKILPHGPFMPQPPEAAIPALPQAFFPHPPTAVLMAQPHQYYPYHQHPQIIHQIPQQNHYSVFHQYPAGRSSVLSHDGSTTPGFQTYDNQNVTFINNTQQFVKTHEDAQKSRNTKSPRHSHSRAQSNSGSSRTTPLMNYQHVNTPMMPDNNAYQHVDNNLATHLAHHINYGIIPFNIPQNDTNTMTNYQTDNINRNQSFDNNNRNFRPNINDTKNGYAANKRDYMPNDKPSYNTNFNNSKPGEYHNTSQMERNMDTIQRMGQAHSFDTFQTQNDRGHFDKSKERRKAFRNSASTNSTLSRQDSFDRGNYDGPVDKLQTYPYRSADGAYQPKHINKYNQKNTESDSTSEPKIPKEPENCKYISNISKEMAEKVASSNLSNEAKAFIPKAETKQDEKTAAADRPDNKSEIKTSNVVFTTQKAVWTKQTIKEFNIKTYLNFPKNRYSYRNTSVGFGQGYSEKTYKSQDKERNFNDKDTFRRNYNRETNHTSNTQSGWISRSMESPASTQQCSTTSSTNASPAPVFTMPHMPKQLPPNQQTPNVYTHPKTANPKDQSTKKDVTPAAADNVKRHNNDHLPQDQHIMPNNGNQLAASFGVKLNIRPNNGTPPMMNAYGGGLGKEYNMAQHQHMALDASGMLQRNQIIQSLGGVGLMQTPPQPTYILRQFPAWLRRAPGPSIFGSPPPMTPHIRHRAPRPHAPSHHQTGQYRQR